jgi:hypothetical protein
MLACEVCGNEAAARIVSGWPMPRADLRICLRCEDHVEEHVSTLDSARTPYHVDRLQRAPRTTS